MVLAYEENACLKTARWYFQQHCCTPIFHCK